MCHSQNLERLAYQIGHYAFSRWAASQGMPISAALAVVRNVF